MQKIKLQKPKNMDKLPSTEQFRTTLRNITHSTRVVGKDESGEFIYDHNKPLPTLQYTGTVKIHGTSARFTFKSNELKIGSREQEISRDKYNAGFAAFCLSKADVLRRLQDKFGPETTVFGEWCGKGINAGCAIHQLDKMFVVFGVKRGDSEDSWLDFSLVDLSEFNEHRIYSIYQFPIYEFLIDFNKPEAELQKIIDKTLEIEKECPVGKFFGVSGVGEGLVLTPKDPEYRSYRYVFKSKGQEHSKSHVKTLPAQDVEKVANARAFAEKHANNERLLQGITYLKENNKSVELTSTGEFLSWVFADIMKEQADELEKNGFTKKDVSRLIANVAKKWFFDYVQKN